MDSIDTVRQALFEGRRDEAERLVDAGAPLSAGMAAALGHLDVLERADPAELDAPDEQGFTPLQLACFFGAPDVARWLLARGADPSSVSTGPPRTTPLLAVLAGPTPDLVADLLAAGADVTLRGDAGFTPLHSAAAHGDAEAVRALLAAGADPAATNDAGATPASLATSPEVAALFPSR